MRWSCCSELLLREVGLGGELRRELRHAGTYRVGWSGVTPRERREGLESLGEGRRAQAHREERDHWRVKSGEHETGRHGKVGVQPSTTGTRDTSVCSFRVLATYLSFVLYRYL